MLTVKKWRLKIIDYLSGYRYPSARYPVVRRCPSMAVRRLSVTVRQCLNVMVHFYFKKFFFQFSKLSRCTDLSSVNGSKFQLKIVDYLSGCRYPSVCSVAVRHQTMAVRRYLNIMVHFFNKKNFFFQFSELSRCTDLSSVNSLKWLKK